MVVEDDLSQRGGYERLLSTSFFKKRGYEFLGGCDGKESFYRRLEELDRQGIEWDRVVVLLDVRLQKDWGQKEGLRIPVELQARYPELNLVINSISSPELFGSELLFLCQERMIGGYIRKSDADEYVLLEIFERVRSGGVYFESVPEEWLNSQVDRQQLIRELKMYYQKIYGLAIGDNAVKSILPSFQIERGIRQRLGLTPLQWSIFLWTSMGKSREEYCDEFGVSTSAYHVHTNRIRQKLKMESNKNPVNWLLIGLRERVPSLVDFVESSCKVRFV